ncbi:MAG TPA: GDSL-type esterase/lipase family protein, partial [Kineobactrum sp.]
MQQFLFPILRTALAIGFSWLLVLPANAAQPRTLLVFGDSISAAYGMSSEQGWVALLSERLEASHPDYTVVNASISGETTAGGLRRLPDLLQRYEPAVVI